MFKQFFLVLATMALVLTGLGAGTGYANGTVWWVSYTEGPSFDNYKMVATARGSYNPSNYWDCGACASFRSPEGKDVEVSTIGDPDLPWCWYNIDYLVMWIPDPNNCFGEYGEFNNIPFYILQSESYPLDEIVQFDYLCARQIGTNPNRWLEYYTWSSPCSSPGKREGEPLPVESTTWGQIKNTYKD